MLETYRGFENTCYLNFKRSLQWKQLYSYATSTDFYKSARDHVQDDDIFHIHRRENLKYRNDIKFAINCITLRDQAPVTAAV